MNVRTVRLPRGWSFACSRKTVAQAFGPDQLDWVSFGAYGRTFRLDRHSDRRPELTGLVVADLTLPPDGEAYLMFYALCDDDYGVEGQSGFVRNVVPYLCDWLAAARIPRGYADSNHKQIIVEWSANNHCYHEVNLPYAPH